MDEPTISVGDVRQENPGGDRQGGLKGLESRWERPHRE